MPYKNPKDKARHDKAYNARPEQKANRASRGRARYALEKSGVQVAGMDVDHKNGNPRDNRRSNLHVMTKHANRSKK